MQIKHVFLLYFSLVTAGFISAADNPGANPSQRPQAPANPAVDLIMRGLSVAFPAPEVPAQPTQQNLDDAQAHARQQAQYRQHLSMIVQPDGNIRAPEAMGMRSGLRTSIRNAIGPNTTQIIENLDDVAMYNLTENLDYQGIASTIPRVQAVPPQQLAPTLMQAAPALAQTLTPQQGQVVAGIIRGLPAGTISPLIQAPLTLLLPANAPALPLNDPATREILTSTAFIQTLAPTINTIVRTLDPLLPPVPPATPGNNPQPVDPDTIRNLSRGVIRLIRNETEPPTFGPLSEEDQEVQDTLNTYATDAAIAQATQDSQEFLHPVFLHRATNPRDVELEDRTNFLETPLIKGPELTDIWDTKYIPALCVEDLALLGLNLAEIYFDSRSIDGYLNDIIDQLTFAIVQKEQPINTLLIKMITEEEPTEEFACETIDELNMLVMDGMKAHPTYKKSFINYGKNRLPTILIEYLKKKSRAPLVFKKTPDPSQPGTFNFNFDDINNQTPSPATVPTPEEIPAKPCPLNRMFPLSAITPWPVVAPFMNSVIANKGLPSNRNMVPYIAWNLGNAFLEAVERPFMQNLAFSPSASSHDAQMESALFIACTELVFNGYFFYFGLNSVLKEKISAMLLNEGNTISTLLSDYERKRARPTLSAQDAEEHRKILVDHIHDIVKKHMSRLQPDIFMELRKDHAKFKTLAGLCLWIPRAITWGKIALNTVSQLSSAA